MVSHPASRRSVLLAFLGLGAFASPVAHVAVPSGGHGPDLGAAPPAARTWMTSPALIFTWAVFGQTGATLSSSTRVDGYDSRQGPYDPARADSTGDVGTNGNAALNSATVWGDVTAAGTVSNSKNVTGTVTQNAPPFPSMPVVTCPTGGYTPSVPSGSGVTYDPATGVLKVSSTNLTLPAPPNQYYFHQVTLSGGATLTINGGGGHVDIYIDDKLTVSGGGIINVSSVPTHVTVFGCGSGTSTWSINGGSGAYFAVYAPTHNVTLSASGDLFGSVVGATVQTQGGYRVHYDQALANAVIDDGQVRWSGTAVTPDTASASRLPSNGTNYTAVFTVQNTGGQSDGYDLLATKRPGSALTVMSITGSGVTQGANPDSARIASLGVGVATPITVTYRVGNVAAGMSDTIFPTARTVGSAADSDNARLRVTVIRPNLTSSRAVSPNNTQSPGTDLTYTLTFTNTGSSDAAGVVMVDTLAPAVRFKVGSVATTLPAGVAALVQYTSAGDTTWTYVPASGACSAPTGYDNCVGRIRWQLQNPLTDAAPGNSGTVQFVAQIR